MLSFLPVVLFVSPFDESGWAAQTTPVAADTSSALQSCSAPSADELRVALLQSAAAKPNTAGIRIVTTPANAPESGQSLWRADDGLFYVDALINGAPVRLLVDTGATMIVLTSTDARRVGAAPEADDYTLGAETAGGKSTMAKVTLASMTVGATAAEGVPAAVAREGLGVSLLGQNWLSHLASVTIEGDRMILH